MAEPQRTNLIRIVVGILEHLSSDLTTEGEIHRFFRSIGIDRNILVEMSKRFCVIYHTYLPHFLRSNRFLGPFRLTACTRGNHPLNNEGLITRVCHLIIYRHRLFPQQHTDILILRIELCDRLCMTLDHYATTEYQP